jgi:outer membrane protein assembly factor BamB
VALAQEPNWNQFRGPKRDNHSFSTGIAKSWSEGGPKLLWKINTIGSGYANVSFFGDMMFTMGDDGNQCFTFALERKTGKEIWKQPIGKAGRGVQGDGSKEGGNQSSGPLGTPACDGETVYVCSQYGDFVALNMKDGKELWRKNIFKDMGAFVMGGWGFSPSPVLDSDKVLLQIGGTGGTLAAFDKSGKLLWRTDWLKDEAAYNSPVPVEIGGVRQYLLLASEHLVGVSTDGQFLWGANFPGKTAVCSDPVLCGDVVMASCAYEVGAYFYRVTKEGNGFKDVSSFKGPDQRLISHHGGIVAVGDHFYLLTNNNLACVEAKTGNTVWDDRSVGKGSLTYVDGVLILRSERGDGTISMVEAVPSGYKELGRFNQPDRSDKNSWSYPVVVDKKLYIRDQNVLLCYDLQ